MVQAFPLGLVPALAFLSLTGLAQGHRLNAPLVTSGDVQEAALSRSGLRILYRADQDVDGVVELFSLRLGQHDAPVRINGPLVPGKRVAQLLLDPDETRVVYMANQDDPEVFELYSAPVDGSGSPVKLNGPIVMGGDVRSEPLTGSALYRISADGARVVYLADQEVDERIELYSAPVDGSAPAVKLNGALIAGGVVLSFKISADGTRVVYRADQEQKGFYELYSVPIDGSAGAVKLNGSHVTGAVGVSSFGVDPTGARVVFQAVLETPGTYELYSAPSDGSAPAVKLNGPLVQGGAVTYIYALSPDGSQVVYVADQDVADVAQIFAVAIDGSAAPLELVDMAVPNRFPNKLQISPDGSRVVYSVAVFVLDFELYSVPIDGSASQVRLSGDLVAGGGVDTLGGPFPFSPDGSRVLYRADQDVEDVQDLYSALVDGGDGSSPAVKLNVSRSWADVQAGFQFSPDGVQVVYRSDQDQQDVLELYQVRADGSSAPRKLHPDLASDRDVLGFVLGGDLVLYRADQDADQVIELYASFLTRPHRGAAVPTQMVFR